MKNLKDIPKDALFVELYQSIPHETGLKIQREALDKRET